MPDAQEPNLTRRLGELAALFLKLGTIGFGGPAAHIALMEDDVVRRRGWLSRETFLDLLGATNLIPGPNSTEMAIHIGHRRAGFPGLIVAGSCFILPAMLIVMSCGWAYVRFGRLPHAQAVLYGVKPVIIAIVVQALWGLSKSALKSGWITALALAVMVLSLRGVDELALLFGAGLFSTATRSWRSRKEADAVPMLSIPVCQPLWAAIAPTAAGALSGAAFGLWPLFWFFLKVGSVLYGSGYVLLAFLRSGLVERFGWLTEQQLLDAVAVGQVTPGPVFTTATFVGYLLGGPPAALLATLGIFLPAFCFVAVSGPLVPRIRRSASASAFLDGVNAASLALMAAVTLQLTRAALIDWVTILAALGTGFLLLRYRINSAWLVLGGAALGLVSR